MKIIKYISIFAALAIQLGCSKQIDSDLQFVYSVDKKGVFIHSLKDNLVKEIYSTKQVFLNDYFILINDSTLQVGHQNKMRSEKRTREVHSKYLYRADGDSTFITDNPPYTTEDNYDYLTDSIFHINVKTADYHLAKVIDYERFEHSNLTIKTREFTKGGKLFTEKDTSFICGGTSSSPKGIRFCDFKRYFSKSETVLGKTIISNRGDLVLKDKKSETVLLKFDGGFDPKFGSGFYNPTLSSDGEKVTFQYLAGFLKSGSCIYEMDLKNKSKNKLIGEGYFNPVYSPDNKLLLLFSDQRKAKNNTWINDIYVFELSTKKKIKLGQGENYVWLPK